MAKFCPNCGSQMQDEDKVCGQCGTFVDSGAVSNTGYTATIPTQGTNVNPNFNTRNVEQSKNAKVGKIAVLAVAALVGLLVILGISKIVGNNTGYKGTLNKYCKAVKDYDVETMESIVSPLMEDESYYYNYDLEELLEKSLKTLTSQIEDKVGDIKKIEYEIDKSKTLSKSKLETMLDQYETKYNSDVSDVKEVMDVELKLKVKGSDKNATFPVSLYLVKQKGGWKILLPSW